VNLTKLPHACFRLEKDGSVLVVDPGVLSDAASALAGASAVLITHEHPDHVDADAVRAAGVPVWAHPSVLDGLSDVDGTPLVPGDTATVAGFEVRVFGDRHAHIHEDVPDLANNAYLIDDRVYYPGDSFSVPGVPVEVLLVPIGGPWMKIAEAIDFVRAVAPTRAHPTHDAVLSAPGQSFSDNWVAQRGNTDYSRLEPGQPVEL
jgi:L-ascorbate metabolism protein UlaG (beta-lactamase superfamily)